MSSQLEIQGVYDKSKRYIVKNWSNEDFSYPFGAEVHYNGDKMITEAEPYTLTIKAGEMKELSQFEAYTFTKHFVDREMYKAAQLGASQKEIERLDMGVNNALLRQPYEEKTLQEIKAGQSTPFMDKMREEIRKEELAKINAVPQTAEVKANEELPVVPEVKSEEFEGVK